MGFSVLMWVQGRRMKMGFVGMSVGVLAILVSLNLTDSGFSPL